MLVNRTGPVPTVVVIPVGCAVLEAEVELPASRGSYRSVERVVWLSRHGDGGRGLPAIKTVVEPAALCSRLGQEPAV